MPGGGATAATGTPPGIMPANSGDYDPFGGLGHTLSAQDALTELARGSAAVADGVIDDLCRGAVEEARRNALLVFVDGFGLSHSLESTDIAVNWVQRIWDRGIDSYKYADDLVEPVPAPFESCTGLT